jgi:phage baseplate assembly protein gpV
MTFFGKYRGSVVNNLDPLQRGRVQVSVPAVFGDGQLAWAEPCAPVAGNNVGFFAVPGVGANVWVEFEAGDPDYPILAGGFWSTQDQAPGDRLPTSTVLKTMGSTLTINDLPGAGGLTIEVGPPAVTTPMKLAMTATGIEISVGSSKVTVGLASVSVNDGALEVM